jgi:hypothetical protein
VNIFVNNDNIRSGVGLMTELNYLGCYREGAASDTIDPAGLYVATRMGHLFSSPNEGKNWKLLAQWLPPIYSVSTAVLN